MIRFAKNEGHEDEEFDLVSIGLVAPKPVEDPQAELERKRYYQQAFLEDLKSHLDTRRDVKTQDNRDQPVNRGGPPPTEFNQPLPEHIRRELEALKDFSGSPSASPPPVVPSGEIGAGKAAWKSINGGQENKLDTNISRQLQRMAEDATGGLQSAGSNPNPFSQTPGPRPQQQGQGVTYDPPRGDSTQPARQPPLPPLPPQPRSVPMPVRTPLPSGQVLRPLPLETAMLQAQALQANASQAPGARMQTGGSSDQGIGQAKPAQALNLPATLSLLIASLDREMEVVAKAGADAFALRDLGRADAALKFSSRLAEYRQMSQELLDYYRRKR